VRALFMALVDSKKVNKKVYQGHIYEGVAALPKISEKLILFQIPKFHHNTMTMYYYIKRQQY